MRVGIGFDVHRLAEGRPLVLGGQTIPFHLGLEGHSDADVLVHALIDAMLGAAALADIGSHFPDTDPAFENVSSILLLKEVAQRIRDAGFRVHNLDVVVLAERPKLAPFRDAMRAEISEALGLGLDFVSVKSTTTEGLGLTGRGEGIAAQAVVLLEDER